VGTEVADEVSGEHHALRAGALASEKPEHKPVGGFPAGLKSTAMIGFVEREPVA
jgi:hypothetical protein